MASPRSTAPHPEHKLAKNFRESMGWSPEELAERTGYSRTSVYLFERGLDFNLNTCSDKAWHRYKLACAGAALLENYKWHWHPRLGRG
jgi:transcriptional regulator with XRE-family HTH domain